MNAGTPVTREDGTRGITTGPTRRNNTTIGVMWEGSQYSVLEQEEDLTPVEAPQPVPGVEPMEPDVQHYLLVETMATGTSAIVVAELDDEDYAAACAAALNAAPLGPGRQYYYLPKP